MTVKCEICAEQSAYVFTGEAAMCCDCFGKAASEALQEAGLGHLCATFLTLPNDDHALCLQPYGSHHDHEAYALYEETGDERLRTVF